MRQSSAVHTRRSAVYSARNAISTLFDVALNVDTLLIASAMRDHMACLEIQAHLVTSITEGTRYKFTGTELSHEELFSELSLERDVYSRAWAWTKAVFSQTSP